MEPCPDPVHCVLVCLVTQRFMTFTRLCQHYEKDKVKQQQSFFIHICIQVLIGKIQVGEID